MLKQTPSQTVGPFFHNALIRGDQNILATEQARGERITIRGRVLDGDGAPIPDAMIEIWQPDARGIFQHRTDPRHAEADPHFRGFGRAETVNNGEFCFVTVKPGQIAVDENQAVAPFINVRIFARGMLIHSLTRLYFADEAANATDPVLSAIDPARRGTLIARRVESADSTTYQFDIVLQGDGETVFFTP